MIKLTNNTLLAKLKKAIKKLKNKIKVNFRFKKIKKKYYIVFSISYIISNEFYLSFSLKKSVKVIKD